MTRQIWVCLQPQDGRKGMDGLAAVVTTHLGRDALGGDLFVFRNRRGDRLKILAWQGDGFLRNRVGVLDSVLDRSMHHSG